jgi:hypothetical protein
MNPFQATPCRSSIIHSGGILATLTSNEIMKRRLWRVTIHETLHITHDSPTNMWFPTFICLSQEAKQRIHAVYDSIVTEQIKCEFVGHGKWSYKMSHSNCWNGSCCAGKCDAREMRDLILSDGLFPRSWLTGMSIWFDNFSGHCSCSAIPTNQNAQSFLGGHADEKLYSILVANSPMFRFMCQYYV